MVKVSVFRSRGVCFLELFRFDDAGRRTGKGLNLVTQTLDHDSDGRRPTVYTQSKGQTHFFTILGRQ